MSIYKGKTKKVALSGTILLVMAICVHCDDDESSNQVCEVNCVTDYANEVDSCEQNTTECMESCSAPDDYDCMWDCEDLESECSYDMIMCISGCSCTEAYMSCYSGCDSNDMDCITSCANGYSDCAGADSPYICVTNCSSFKTSCMWDCEDTSTTMSEYLECRAVCHTDFVGCVDSCI